MTSWPPRWACEFTLWLVLFFGVAAFGATEWWSRAVLESLIFILAAMCSLRSDFASPSRKIIIGFGVVIVLGIIQAFNVRSAAGPAGFVPFTVARPQTLYAILVWVAMASLAWSASGILRWEGALRRLSVAIFLIGLFISVIGIVQRGQGNVAYYGLRIIRPGTNPFGPFTNYNHAANWMAASTLIGASLFVEGLQFRDRVPFADRMAQLFLAGFIMCVAVAGVIQTGSRGAINSLFLAAIISGGIVSVTSVHERFRGFVFLGLAMFAVSYGMFLYAHPKWIGLVGRMFAEDSAAYRVSMYRSGLRMFADYPLWGIGLGGFQKAFSVYQETFVIGVVDHVHSSWLEIALESGFVGAIAFGSVSLSMIVALGRLLTQGAIQSRVIDMGYFAALLAGCLHGIVEFTFQIPANAALFCVLLAAAASILIPVNPQPPQIQRPRLLMVLVFAGFAIASVAPGLSGASLRWNAPFANNNDRLWINRR